MKIKTKLLSDALALLRPICGKRQTLPVLSCAKIEASNGLMTISVTNLDQYQTEQIECDGTLGACCVNLARFTGALGFDESCVIELKDGSLSVKCGARFVKIPTLAVADYPTNPDMKLEKSAGVSCEELAKSIMAVKGFEHESFIARGVLAGIHITGKSKTLTCEATDGRNLAKLELPLICSDFEAVVLPDAIAGLVSALEREGCDIKFGTNWVSASHASGSFSSRLAEGIYPNTKQLETNTKFDLLGSLEVGPALRELESCVPFFDPKITNVAPLDFSKSGISFSFESETGRVESVIAGDFKKHNASVDINSTVKCIKAIKGSSCEVFQGENILMLISGAMKILTVNFRAAA